MFLKELLVLRQDQEGRQESLGGVADPLTWVFPSSLVEVWEESEEMASAEYCSVWEL